MYKFTALTTADYYLLYNFLNETHVIDFHTRKKINMEGIDDEYGLYLSAEIPKKCFIVHEDEVPIGTAKHFRLDDFPNYQAEVDLENAIGIELIIAREGYFHKGKAKAVIEAFISDQDLTGHVLFAACSLDNTPAIRAFEKAGFVNTKEIFNIDKRDMEYILVKS